MVDQSPGEIQDVSVSGLADAMTPSSEITANTSSGMDLPRTVAEPSGLSVEWADSVDDRSMDEAVLQISGAGHWFLEGWIGDHSVDFLVVECIFLLLLSGFGASWSTGGCPTDYSKEVTGR